MTAATEPMPDGVLLVDKPSGCTSFDVIRQIRRHTRRVKIGHAGTLDPMATGLLPLCVGEATKLVRFLAGEDKRYLARLRLGLATSTLDREGSEVARAAVPELSDDRVQASLSRFTGEIRQVPPMYSALKHQGQRMYDLARKGIEVDREPRSVRIEALDLLACGDDWLSLDVTCSTGTYIRSLVADIAKDLGTVGHLEALQRIRSSGWDLGQAHTLANLTAEGKASIRAAILPLEGVLVARWTRVEVDEQTGKRLSQGQHLSPDELHKLGLDVAADGLIVWFCPPTDESVAMARITAEAGENRIGMEILRVFRLKRASRA